ncbi:hypothetical protein BC829DRAFT_391608 [Chytridium lagenaria]|nr:hypothetical protein BC829DRAFT_391608 [Chytridium lagenaria]
MGKFQITRDDPRQHDAIVPFVQPKVREEDVDADLLGFLSILTGVGGVITRMRLLSWVALIGSIVSYLSTKGSEREYRQGAGSLSFTIMGIILLYVNLLLPKLQQPPA